MCKSPTYIINPSYGRLNFHGYTEVYAYGDLLCNGKLKDFTKRPLWILRQYSEDYKGMSQQQLDENFVLYNPTTKTSKSLIIAAPCRKCDECQKEKYNELLARSMYEYASDPEQELAFFTLTYAPQYLPEGSNVSMEDIKKFRKHFTTYFDRFCNKEGKYDTPRMVICSEYGPSVDKYGRIGKRRPHYHGYMFLGNYRPSHEDFPTDTLYYRELNRMFRLLKKAVLKSWHKCYEVAFDMQLSKHPLKTLRYCTKYVLKQLRQNAVPSGRVPNFVSAPRGSRGGLSAPFLSNPSVALPTNSQSVYKLPLSFVITNFETGKKELVTEMVSIPRFMTNKMYPTYSRINDSQTHKKVFEYEHKLKELRLLYNECCKLVGKFPRTETDGYGRLLNHYQRFLSDYRQKLLPKFAIPQSADYSKLHGFVEQSTRIEGSTPRGSYERMVEARMSPFAPSVQSWEDPLGILSPSYENVRECNEIVMCLGPSETYDFRTRITDILRDLQRLHTSLNGSLQKRSISLALISDRNRELYLSPLRLIKQDRVINQTKLDSFFAEVDTLADFSKEMDDLNDMISAKHPKFTNYETTND